MSTIDNLLRVLPDAEHDKLVPLLEAEPVIERLTGRRPHRSALHRWATKGTAGVRLEVVRVGGTRFVSPRMLVAFFAAAGEASASAPLVPQKKARPRASGRTVNVATAKTASPGGSRA